VGHLFARTWELPTYICEAILHHHDLEPLKSKLGSFPAKEADLIAVLILSVHLAGIHLGLEDKALLAASTTQTLALQHLGIGHEKFMTMADEVLEFLQQAKE
jgi:HD-like signal output (HDOD) protein